MAGIVLRNHFRSASHEALVVYPGLGAVFLADSLLITVVITSGKLDHPRGTSEGYIIGLPILTSLFLVFISPEVAALLSYAEKDT